MFLDIIIRWTYTKVKGCEMFLLKGVDKLRKIAGYRVMIGLTQSQMASKMGISRQSYYAKETGKTPFKDSEKKLFRDLIRNLIPNITIDEIFFN